MYLQHVRKMMVAAVAVVMLAFSTTAKAQGTANGPLTFHSVTPGPIVVIGSPLNPFPIDLDPVGPPWTKHIDDPNGLMLNGGVMELNESIINVGTEPWYDWHEHIQPNIPGVFPPFPGIWLNAVMTVNGNPIGFNANGFGTPNLDLFNFSQPVLPGDILNIRKQIHVFANTTGVPGFLMEIQEYPTPEPASAALIGLGSLALMARRRATFN